MYAVLCGQRRWCPLIHNPQQSVHKSHCAKEGVWCACNAARDQGPRAST